MAGLSRKNKKIVSALLTGLFVMQQTICLNAFGSEITGITAGGSGTFNIDPTSIDGNVGFRSYDVFNLSEGDIANLIYTGQMDTFVNLMQNNAFNINGIINTMNADGGFANGKAVFVSPKGVVVGASGVLNVGSLGMYTPSPDKYNSLSNSLNAATWNSFETSMANGQATGAAGAGDAVVKIDGKVFTAGDATIHAGSINVGEGGGIFAGVAQDLILNDNKAQQLFDALVNTSNQKPTSQYANGKRAKVTLTSAGWGDGKLSQGAGIKINGNVVNLGSGNSFTKFENRVSGNDGINIGNEARVYNANGLLDIYNMDGSINISGSVRNDGNETNIINARGNTTVKSLSENSGLTISGDVTSGSNATDTLKIQNTGNQGLNISGTVNHTGNAEVINGYSQTAYTDTAGLNIAQTGKFTTSGSATFTNYASGVDGLNVAGQVETGSKATFNNYGAGGLNVMAGSDTSISGNRYNIKSNGLEMNNYGANGLNIGGIVQNEGTASIHNYEGGAKGLNVNGSVTSKGDTTFT
ncbi:leukotoxin LktA family filamentous adhesin, partial [bacterium]|nr:leukotoxin LktA family filamentous adhesin [bacterium]